MTYNLSKKQISLALLCALSLLAVSSTATAQTKSAYPGYLTDTAGNLVKSPFGLCWRTGTGPWESTPECDPNYVAPTAKAVEVAPPPTAIAAVPTPAPKAVIVPATEKATFQADTLFDFDKSVLRPAGIQALDDFVARIKDVHPEVITAVGHADRFGTDRYNQSLSERRVDAVRTYLLSKGIASNRLQTEGKGKTQPITKAGDCTGAKSTKVIACLQPDRRVELEVVGIRVANSN